MVTTKKCKSFLTTPSHFLTLTLQIPFKEISDER